GPDASFQRGRPARREVGHFARACRRGPPQERHGLAHAEVPRSLRPEDARRSAFQRSAHAEGPPAGPRAGPHGGRAIAGDRSHPRDAHCRTRSRPGGQGLRHRVRRPRADEWAARELEGRMPPSRYTRRRFVAGATTLGVALAIPWRAAPAAQEPAARPLVPREVLFGDPDRAWARLSHDGAWLSYIAPVDGVRNLWVAPVADLAA